MKFLKVIILAIFLLSIFPLGAFCGDEHQDGQTTHGHCVLMSHSSCVHATVPEQKLVFIPAIQTTSSVLPAYNFFYQNPSLDAFRRPPAFSA